MSTESHNTDQQPRHTDVSFEERDIKAGTIYGYLFALGAAVVVSALICVYILRFTSCERSRKKGTKKWNTRTITATTPQPPYNRVR